MSFSLLLCRMATIFKVVHLIRQKLDNLEIFTAFVQYFIIFYDHVFITTKFRSLDKNV